MKKFFDLRFVIGVFFLTVGVLLLIYSLLSPPDEGFSPSVNFWSSILFIIFSVGMLLLSVKKPLE